jgi:hypothetical protein
MATCITVTGQKKIATLQAEFTERFPHLGIMLFSEEEYERSCRGERVRPLSADQTIASVRTRKNAKSLSIHGRTHIGTLEETFLEEYGLRVQVCIRRNGKGRYTGEGFDGHSLTAVERHAAAEEWDLWV